LLHHRKTAGATVDTESDDADHVEIILDEPTPESLPAAKPIARSRWQRWRTPIAAVTNAALALGTVLVPRQGAETERAATEPTDRPLSPSSPLLMTHRWPSVSTH
jgi:hypothetical protein